MKRDTGFTLVEIMVVIAIMAILSVVVFSNFGPFRTRAHRAAAQAHGSEVLSAVNAWARNNPASSLSAALSTAGLAAADFSDAPASMPQPSNAYDCSAAGAIGGYSWSNADPKTACAVYADTSAGFESPAVLTWVRHDDEYYLNGARQ